MGDNLNHKKCPKSKSENPVRIKDEPLGLGPPSPTQTVVQGQILSLSDIPCNIRLAPLQTLQGGIGEDYSPISDLDFPLVPASTSSSNLPQCQWKEWRHHCGRSIREKLLFALEHDNFYKDVTLIVGKDNERISAHKLILRMGSPVLENIMQGLNSSSDCTDTGTIMDILEIPEVEPFAFRQLLQFMYTDEFNAENLRCSDIMMILQAAKRFQIQDLASLCIQSLKNHINDETAISLCEMGNDVDDLELRELRDMALSYICRNPKKIFYSPNFMDLSYKNLVLLIEHDSLEWDEISIFKSVVRWAAEFCSRRGLNPCANNLRGALGEIIYRIRFPLMSAEQFTFDVIPLKVLTSEEQVQVFKYLCLTDTSAREQLEPTSFNCKRRSQVKDQFKFKDDDSTLMKTKGESPHCQLALASTFTDFTEPESEDTSSQVSSCISSSLSASTSKLKRPRSPSPQKSPPCNKKHISLFGDIQPKRIKDRPSKRKSIELENTIGVNNGEIEFNQFIEECSANHRRKEIELIKLSGVIVTDHEKIQGRKVRFPKLKDFHIDIKIPSLKHKDVNTLASEISVEDYLFFTLKVGKKWSLSEIWSLGMNITLIINGITLIRIDHNKKSLIVNKVKECSKILDSVNVDEEGGIRSLVISQPFFPGTSNSFPAQSLERLVLLRVDKIPEFNVFIRKFKRLKELCILSSDNKVVDLNRDFSSRDRLRKLALGSATFNTTAMNNPLKNLAELFLFRCEWETVFEDNFQFFFPNLKRAYFFLGHKVAPKLLSKLFLINSMLEVGCGCFDWNSASDKGEIRCTIDVLHSAGLTENDKSFVITKDCSDLKASWVGKKGSLDLSQEEIFKNFQFYHLYSDYTVFRS